MILKDPFPHWPSDIFRLTFRLRDGTMKTMEVSRRAKPTWMTKMLLDCQGELVESSLLRKANVHERR